MPDADQIIAARRIEQTIKDARQLMVQHKISQNTAARLLRVAAATLSRQMRAYAAGGLMALCPGKSTGRPKAMTFSKEESSTLKKLVLQTGSTPIALELLAESKVCSPENRAKIESRRGKGRFPLSARRAAYVTPEEQALHRGPRAFQLLVYHQKRDMHWIDENGIRRPIRCGDFWEFDDMSVNEPYWFEWPYGGDPLSDKFGVRLGRQALIAREVRGRWLGCDLIGRVRDAYRAEDVLRFIGRLFADYGVPEGIRLERGVWASRVITGIVRDGQVVPPVVVDGPTQDEVDEAFGGVDQITRIQHVWTPNAKGLIEGGFNLLQKLLALNGVTIGRKRGEFEQATKHLLACQAGRRHPQDCGFLHIDAMSKKIDDAFQYLNAREMDGRLLRGVADDLWTQRIHEHGPLPTLPTELRWILCPAKGERAIKGGHIDVRLAHYGQHVFSFRVPTERFPYLGTDYRLGYAFDPAEPSAGCHLFNAESGVRNQHDLSPGQWLGVAPWNPDRAQLDFSGAAADTNGRKQATAAARTAYRQSGAHGAPARKVSQAIDGTGSVARVEIGGRATEAENTTISPLPRGQASATQTGGAAQRGGGIDLDAMRLRNEARRQERRAALGLFSND